MTPNTGTQGGLIGTTGINQAGTTDFVLSRATKIVKLWIPGNKFDRNGKIKYEKNASIQVKFFDYEVVLYAYSNFSIFQDLFNVGRVNDYIKMMYYKDGYKTLIM